MFSIAKASALLRGLHDNLQIRFSNSASLNQVSSYFSAIPDAAGALWPYLIISLNGAVAEGNSVVYIRLQDSPMISKDIFGNSTDAYSPTNMTLAYELNSSGAPIPLAADLATIQFEALKLGTPLALVQLPNGTAVTDANVQAASPVVSLDDLLWPTKAV